MSSFIRQLGSYGFQKIASDDNKDNGAYFNELFLRGRGGLCKAIIRRQKRRLVDRTSEPDLHKYDPMPLNNVNDECAGEYRAPLIQYVVIRSPKIALNSFRNTPGSSETRNYPVASSLHNERTSYLQKRHSYTKP